MAEKRNEMATTGTSPRFLALTGEMELTPEEIFEEMDGDSLIYPDLRHPGSGAISIEMPDPENMDELIPVKTIDCVVVAHYKANSYWPSAGDDISNDPPQCYSIGAEHGVGDPGGACATCPLNQFGSGEGGKGKACKNTKQLYILTQDMPLPMGYKVPPTSLRNLNKHITLQIARGRKLCDVMTRITFTKVGEGQSAYSIANFAYVGDLEPAERTAAATYRAGIEASITRTQAEAQQQDYEDLTNTETPFDVDETTGEVIE